MFKIFRCIKRIPSPLNKAHSALQNFWRTPQISPWVRKGRLSRTSLTKHIKCRWSLPHSPPLEFPQSDSPSTAVGGVKYHYHNWRQSWWRWSGCNLQGFHIWKSTLVVRSSLRPFPGKEAGTGARTQAPFWPNIYCPFTTCHFWFRNCLWLVFQH